MGRTRTTTRTVIEQPIHRHKSSRIGIRGRTGRRTSFLFTRSPRFRSTTGTSSTTIAQATGPTPLSITAAPIGESKSPTQPAAITDGTAPDGKKEISRSVAMLGTIDRALGVGDTSMLNWKGRTLERVIGLQRSLKAPHVAYRRVRPRKAVPSPAVDAPRIDGAASFLSRFRARYGRAP